MKSVSTNRSSVTRGRARLFRVAQAFLPVVFAFVLALTLSPRASADAGVVLNESLDTSVARITGSGHSAVYLSRICPDNSPVKMRLCHPGEQGSVLSNYTTLGEASPYEWNIVPLSIYLYGVENPDDRPLMSSKEIKTALEERYRQKYLTGLCDTKKCLTSNSAEWREMVGATLERSLYMFVVKTTVEQDEALIAEYNARPNVNHFHGATNNCADFTRRVMDFYFPHAVHRDALNDFFMTSPKAAAHSLAKFADANPELDLRVVHFAQVPGTIKRSSECRSGTEEIYHSKKFLAPLAVFAWEAIPAVTASYMLTGRFNPEHQFEVHASADLGSPYDDAAATPALPQGESVSVRELAAEEADRRESIVGTKDVWKQNEEAFATTVDQAVSDEMIPDRAYLKHVFNTLNRGAKITTDPNGALWLDFTAVAHDSHGEQVRVGISASNLFAPGSDAQFAYQLMLARLDCELAAPKHSRENLLEYRTDAALLADVNTPAVAQKFSLAPASSPRHHAHTTSAKPTTPAKSIAATQISLTSQQ
ncbi:MAG: hypothetical protein WB985_05310 [Candidatus Acidiferrales bacterium]